MKQQHCQQPAQTEGNRQHNNRKKGKTTKRKSHVLLIWKTLPREKKPSKQKRDAAKRRHSKQHESEQGNEQERGEEPCTKVLMGNENLGLDILFYMLNI